MDLKETYFNALKDKFVATFKNFSYNYEIKTIHEIHCSNINNIHLVILSIRACSLFSCKFIRDSLRMYK